MGIFQLLLFLSLVLSRMQIIRANPAGPLCDLCSSVSRSMLW
jgi:hypothetical protein